MQHIYSHAQNLGNECPDHAAALGTSGPVSNQNIRTRWINHSFDSNSLFALCDNLDDVLQAVSERHICLLHNVVSLWFVSVSMQKPLHTSTCSSLLTSVDSDEYDEHNMWNHMLCLSCYEYGCAVMESYLDEAVLKRIALSCHFALDLLCDKAEEHYRPMLRLAISATLPFVRASVGSLA